MQKNHWSSFFLYSLLTLFFLQDWILQFSHSILGSETGDGSLTIWIAYWPYLKIKSFFTGESLEPYLNSNIFYGFERAYSFSDMMPALIPFVFILDTFFQNPILTVNSIQLSLILMLPFGTYLLYRELGFDVSLSFLSGMICSFSGFHIHQYLHFQLQFIGFVPFGIVYTMRFFKKPSMGNLSIIGGILVFLAGSTTHIFIYFLLSLFLLTLIYFYFIIYGTLAKSQFLQSNSRKPQTFFRMPAEKDYYYCTTYSNNRGKLYLYRDKIIENIKKFYLLYFKSILVPKNLIVIFLTLTIVIFLIYPFIYNIKFSNFKRLKVDTLLFSFSPLDYKNFGFDPIHLLFLFSYLFIPLQWKTFSYFEKFMLKMILLLCTLIYLFSLGARKYYPYNLLYDFFPGFSGIRDCSRIFYLFWFPFGAGIALILKKSHRYISQKIYYRSFLLGIFLIEVLLIWIRSPQVNPMHFPEEIKQIHEDYSRGMYQEPLLIVSNRTLFTSYTDIDAYSQYLSIFHKKNLVGGYSGQYPYSLFMLRNAVSSYLSGESQWKKEEIETVLASSPVGSIALYDVPENWKKKLSSLNGTSKNQGNPCEKLLKGKWRNLPKISPNYGLILGYTPNQDFCINPYNLFLDLKVSLKWIKEEKIIYTDILYIHSPFYHHPSAPELLYNTEGFRDRGEYTLQLFQDGEVVYTGKVLVQ